MDKELRKQLRKYVTVFSDNLEDSTELALLANILTQGTALLEHTPDGSFHKLDNSLRLEEVYKLPFNSLTRSCTEYGDTLYTGVAGNIIVEYNFTAKILMLAILELDELWVEGSRGLDYIATFMHIDEPVGDFDEWFVTHFTSEGTAIRNFNESRDKFDKYAERGTSLGLLYRVITQDLGNSTGDWAYADSDEDSAGFEDGIEDVIDGSNTWHSDFYASPEEEALAMAQLARFKKTTTWDTRWDGFKPRPYKHVSKIPEGASPTDKTTFQGDEITYQELDDFARTLGESIHIGEELLAYRQKHGLINEPTKEWVDDGFDWR